MKNLKIFTNIFLRKIVLLFILFCFLYLDSNQLEKKFNYGFLILNILSVIAFYILFRRGNYKVRQFMLFFVVSALLVEYIGSLYLHAYTYKRVYIPLYVLLGQYLIYDRLYTFSKHHIVKKFTTEVNSVTLVLILILSFHSLLAYDDYFGFFGMILLFILLFFYRVNWTFFLVSYVFIAFMELMGTYFGCWKWIDRGIAFFEFMPINNPPIGASTFYFLIPLITYIFYFSVNNSVWRRFKRVKFNK